MAGVKTSFGFLIKKIKRIFTSDFLPVAERYAGERIKAGLQIDSAGGLHWHPKLVVIEIKSVTTEVGGRDILSSERLTSKCWRKLTSTAKKIGKLLLFTLIRHRLRFIHRLLMSGNRKVRKDKL